MACVHKSLDRRRFAEPADAFLFDVDKWGNSKSAQRMSFSQRGVYLEMLFYQWKKRNLPNDAQQVAELISITPAQEAEVIAAWDVVRRNFATCDGDATRVYNVALEHTRRKQLAMFRQKQSAGRTAGLASASKRLQRQGLGVNDRSTTVQRSLTTVQRPSTVVNSKDLICQDLSGSDRNSKEPIKTEQIAVEGLDAFARFWTQYPKKVGKDDAKRAWTKRRPDIDVVLAALIRQNTWLLRDGGQFVPNPATWLNQGRWQDDPPAIQTEISSVTQQNLLARDRVLEKLKARG